MKRVFLYVRVSTEEQALHGLSIDAQTMALEEWAKENGHKVVGVYTDAGISARKPASKRPELQRLLADAQAGKGDLIVFTKLDRWFRNIAEYYKVQEVLEKYHVDWRTIHEDYDTSTASGRLKINIMLSVAQDEADRASERIKAIMEAKRQKREALTGNCPTGYMLEGKKLVMDPEKEPAVRAFFQKFLACGSVSEAQRAAQEKGTRIEYQLASKMLDSPAYYGYYYDIDGMAPPYITKNEFDKIQKMRVRVVRKSPKNRIYLFSGLVSCGCCGFRMGGRNNTKSKFPFYNCPGHYIKRSGCINKTNISEKKIEEYLFETVDEKIKEYRFELEQMIAQREKRNYKSEISALRARLRRLKDLYLNELITLDECKIDQGEIQGKIDALEQGASASPERSIQGLDAILKDGWKEDYLSVDRSAKREFWRIIVSEIRIYPDRHIEYDLRI